MFKFLRGQTPDASVPTQEKPKYRQLTHAEVGQIQIGTRLDIRDTDSKYIGSLRTISKPSKDVGRKCLVTPGLESPEGAYARVDLPWHVIEQKKQGSQVTLYSRDPMNGSLINPREVTGIYLVEGTPLRNMDNPFALNIHSSGKFEKVEMGSVQITVDLAQEN